MLFFFLYDLHFNGKKIKCNILYKPSRHRKFNIIRAPYKNKIAQNSYAYSRYSYCVFLKTADKVVLTKAFFELCVKLFTGGFLSTNVNFAKCISFSKYYKLKI